MNKLFLMIVFLLTVAWSPFPGAWVEDEKFHEVSFYTGYVEFESKVPNRQWEKVIIQVPERFGDMNTYKLADAPCRGWWRLQFPHPDERYKGIILYFKAESLQCLLIEERPKLGRGLWWWSQNPPSSVLEGDAVEYLNSICAKDW